MRRKIIAGIVPDKDGIMSCEACGKHFFVRDAFEKEEGSILNFYHCGNCGNGAIIRVFDNEE